MLPFMGQMGQSLRAAPERCEKESAQKCGNGCVNASVLRNKLKRRLSFARTARVSVRLTDEDV